MKNSFILVLLFILFLRTGASPWPIAPSIIEGPYDSSPKTDVIPEGLVNVAFKKPVTVSDKFPIVGDPEYATDGVRSKKWKDIYDLRGVFFDEGYYLQVIAPGWVQIDLGKQFHLYGIGLWYRHVTESYDVPYGVVVQISNTEDFSEEVTVVFNCDYKNSLKLGQGMDRQFATSRFGKFIPIEHVKARFVRVWGTGSARYRKANVFDIIEIEVYEEY